MASVRQRGKGRWELRVSQGRGVAYRTKTVLARNKTEATRQAQEWEVELRHGLHPERKATERRTVTVLADEWFRRGRGPKGPWSPPTRRQHRGILDNHVLPALGDLRVVRTIPGAHLPDVLSRQRIDRFYQDLETGGLQASTVQRVAAVLQSMLRLAVEWDWIDMNPATTVSPPVAVTIPAPAPTVDEVRRLLEVIRDDNPEFFMWVALGAVTGCRRSELLGLRRSKVNLDAGWLDVTGTVVDGDRGLEVRDRTKTVGSTRRVPLGSGTIMLLAAHLAAQDATAASFGGQVNVDGFVFTRTPDGQVPWRPEFPSNLFARYRNQLGLRPALQLRHLRNFVVTQLHDAGTPLRTSMGFVGHASPNTHLSVYARTVDASSLAAAKHLDRLIATGNDYRADKDRCD